MPELPRRRFWSLQFNLGSLLWFMLVFGMGLTWWNDRRRFEARLARLEGNSTPQPSLWSAAEALGAPDDLTGMQGKSWCPAGVGSPEWIELEWDRAVVAATIDIHETYSVGAVTEVCVFDQAGAETVIWSGTDPNTAGRTGIFRVPVTVKQAIQRVKISLDNRGAQTWNCIDAVGLTTSGGKTTWASSVETSSSFAGTATTATNSKPWFRLW